MSNPNKPVAAIIGGSKVSDKVLLLENLIKKVDSLFIGGAMAHALLNHVNNMQVGKSLVEKDEKTLKACYNVIETAKKHNVKI